MKLIGIAEAARQMAREDGEEAESADMPVFDRTPFGLGMTAEVDHPDPERVRQWHARRPARFPRHVD